MKSERELELEQRLNSFVKHEDSGTIRRQDSFVHSLGLTLDSEEADKALCAEPIRAERPRSFSESMKALAESQYMSVIVFGAVGLNGIQMGIQSDHSGPAWDVIFYSADNIFTAIFFVEMCIKLAAYKRQYFRDRWNIFDFTLTWVSVFDMWILAAIGADSGIKVLAVLRVFRIFRVVRLLRLLHRFRELTLIIEGLISALGTSSWVSLLLVALLYIFSIFCVYACGGPGIYEGYDTNSDHFEEAVSFNNYQYFGSILRSMFTLLQIVLLSDDWFVVSRALLERQPVVLVFFIIFMAITTFGLLNVIVGIVVDSVTASAKGLDDEKESEEQLRLLKRLEHLYQFVMGLDVGHDGSIDIDELKRGWNVGEMKELLQISNLPVAFDADELLALLDADGDRRLSKDEVTKGLVRLLLGSTHQQILELKACQNQMRREVNMCPQKNHDVLMTSIREEMAKIVKESIREEMANSVATSVREEVAKSVAVMQQQLQCSVCHRVKCCSCCHRKENAGECTQVVGDTSPSPLADSSTRIVPGVPLEFRRSESKSTTGCSGMRLQRPEVPQEHSEEAPGWSKSVQEISRSASQTPPGLSESTGNPGPQGVDSNLKTELHEVIESETLTKFDCNQSKYNSTPSTTASQCQSSGALDADKAPDSPLNMILVTSLDGMDVLTPRETQLSLDGTHGSGVRHGSDNTVEFATSFGEGVNRLGFEVDCRFETPTITRVLPSGEADQRGLCSGDAILTINGTTTTGRCREDVLLKLRERPVVMTLHRGLLIERH